MFLFCFAKILNQAFLHGPQIWLRGFFTFLVALAHGAPPPWRRGSPWILDEEWIIQKELTKTCSTKSFEFREQSKFIDWSQQKFSKLLHTIGRNDLVCGYIIGILLNIGEINDCMSFFVTQYNFIFFTICIHANLDDIIHKSFLWSLDISFERNFRLNCLWIGKVTAM